jgi:competence protein ComEA
VKTGKYRLRIAAYLLTLSMALVLVSPGKGQEKINLNTAGDAELQQLPGIGSILSQRIIDYRQTNGPFRNPEEITRVFGVGAKKYEAIKDLITVGDGESGPPAPPPVVEIKPGKVNINTAGRLELETLPGIGRVKAQRIIDYRKTHGGFRKIEELTEIYGIGPKTLANLEELVTLRNGTLLSPALQKSTPRSGPLTLKCWKCQKIFTIQSGIGKGTCPHCGAEWELSR